MKKTAGLSATLALVAGTAFAQDKTETEVYQDVANSCAPVILDVWDGKAPDEITGQVDCTEALGEYLVYGSNTIDNATRGEIFSSRQGAWVEHCGKDLQFFAQTKNSLTPTARASFINEMTYNCLAGAGTHVGNIGLFDQKNLWEVINTTTCVASAIGPTDFTTAARLEQDKEDCQAPGTKKLLQPLINAVR